MDTELLRELPHNDPNLFGVFNFTQECIDIYNKALDAMGLGTPESMGQAVDNSQVNYSNPQELGEEYGDLSIHY